MTATHLAKMRRGRERQLAARKQEGIAIAVQEATYFGLMNERDLRVTRGEIEKHDATYTRYTDRMKAIVPKRKASSSDYEAAYDAGLVRRPYSGQPRKAFLVTA